MTTYRQRAQQLLDLATNNGNGVTATDGIYREVTQNRDPGPVYSSCVDLPFWLLRKLVPGKPRWLVEGPATNPFANFWGAPWRPPRAFEIPRKGDVWMIWGDGKTRTHAKVVSSFNEATSELTSYDYGQGWTDPAKYQPGEIEGVRKTQQLEKGPNGEWVWPDGRTLRLVLPLDTALGHSADVEMPGGFVWVIAGAAAAAGAGFLWMKRKA